MRKQPNREKQGKAYNLERLQITAAAWIFSSPEVFARTCARMRLHIPSETPKGEGAKLSQSMGVDCSTFTASALRFPASIPCSPQAT